MSERYPATFLTYQNPSSVVGAYIFPTVLWMPAFTIPGEHGKTPYMPLGINSMAGTDVCHTRRRRRNLPHASDINSVMGTYKHHVPDGVGNKT